MFLQETTCIRGSSLVCRESVYLFDISVGYGSGIDRTAYSVLSVSCL